MILIPLGTPLPEHFQDRGRHILDILQGLPLEQQLDLACRTVRAVLPDYHPPARRGMGCQGGR